MFKKIKAVNMLKEYCKQNNIALIFTFKTPKAKDHTEITHKPDFKYIIKINPYQSLDKIISALLHEIGKTILYNKMSKFELSTYSAILSHFNSSYNSLKKENLITIKKYEFYTVLLEEKKSWNIGKELAEKLNIYLPQKYNFFLEENLNYFKQIECKMVAA